MPDDIHLNLLIRPICTNKIFKISIKSFSEDVCKSVDDYINRLKKDTEL